jgi:hypothetical protein
MLLPFYPPESGTSFVSWLFNFHRATYAYSWAGRCGTYLLMFAVKHAHRTIFLIERGIRGFQREGAVTILFMYYTPILKT